MNDNQKPVIIEIIMVTNPEDCYVTTKTLIIKKKVVKR